MLGILHSPVKWSAIRWLLIAAGLLLLYVIWLVFIANNITPDEKIFGLVSPYISESQTHFMKAISFLGNHKFLVPANLLFIIYLLAKKNWWGAISAGVVGLSSLGLMSVLKNIIQRSRPVDPLVEGITNYSFPSGHALMSVAFYGLLAGWTLISLKNKWQQGIVISVLILLVLLVGFSRIYLRLHYTSDVMAGLCIGTIWLAILFSLMDTIQAKYTQAKK